MSDKQSTLHDELQRHNLYIVYLFDVYTIDMSLCLTISMGDYNFACTKVFTKYDTIFIKQKSLTRFPFMCV